MIDRSYEGLDDLAIHDRVLVEVDLAGRITGFRAVIVKVGPDELWLGLASPDRRLEGIGHGKQIRLTVARQGGAVVGTSTFLRHMGESRCRIFAVAVPARLELVQRRMQQRIALELTLQLRRIDPATGQPCGKAAVGSTVNVSPGGLLFDTNMALAVGEELDLTLVFSATDRVSASARVSRVGEVAHDVASTLPAGATLNAVGVKFTRITTVDQARIVRQALLAEHRRKEAARTAPAPVAQAPRAVVAPVAVASGVGTAAAARLAPAVVRTEEAIPQAPTLPAPTAAPPSLPVAVRPRPILPGPGAGANEPLIGIGLRLAEEGDAMAVRSWFDGLGTGDRVGLLCQMQENMAGTALPGAKEPGAVRPLLQALGLI